MKIIIDSLEELQQLVTLICRGETFRSSRLNTSHSADIFPSVEATVLADPGEVTSSKADDKDTRKYQLTLDGEDSIESLYAFIEAAYASGMYTRLDNLNVGVLDMGDAMEALDAAFAREQYI